MADEAAHADGCSVNARRSIYLGVRSGDRVRQGEVIEGLIEWSVTYGEDLDEVVGYAASRHTLAVVLSQDCDLEQDWRKRSADANVVTDLPSLLFCPATLADQALGAIQGSDIKKSIKNNKNDRYHYLADILPVESDETAVKGPLVLDFKRLFTVRTVEIYRQLRGTGAEAPRRRCYLDCPWAEHLQCRLANYSARIALPRDHFIPDARRSE